MEGKYLITTDAYFIAPDGKSYRAAWGEVQIVEDSALGVKTNRNSSNWYARVGSEKSHIIIAGCQIHYAVKCETKPNDGPAEDWTLDSAGLKIAEAPSKIYITE